MIKKNSFYALAVATMLASCNNTTTVPETTATDTAAIAPAGTPAKPIEQLRWLVGNWQSKTPDGIAFENWTALDDSTFTAVSGFIKGKDTMVSETISLEQRGGELTYIPTVKDQNEGKPVPFKMAAVGGDSVVFADPGHDFPDKITYTKKSPTSLVAKISGKINGKEHEESFQLDKVQ
ncbi:MAG: DUF6265 family protein [Bacteroidota bacterium]